ncbi:MAG TPA: AMP-binding protein [Fastidiosipila sp.]|nr:AMP-binding protein [Eubacteriales bacterium]MDD3611083.1 AMP-binding protein [Eubacteriales bacterium]HHU03554.1 AMP-binding protein [Fastidiosipila sp.]
MKFEENLDLYKFPLYPVREIKDLRDMIEQSEVLYADETAYMVKDPIALREIEPRSEDAKQLRQDPARSYGKITFRQFINDVRAFATGLMQLGVKSGCRVAIFAETRYEWYVSYLAVVNGLAVVVPLDKEQPAAELLSLVQRSNADTLLYSNFKKELVEEMRPQMDEVERFIQFDLPAVNDDGTHYFWDILQEGQKRRDAGDRDYDDLPIDREAMSVLLFTSGTSSKSKAVMLSHKNICTNLMGMCSMVYIDEKDTFLSVLPLHHTYECTCGYLCQLYRGSAVAVSDGLRHIVNNMKEAGVTIILVVPLMVEAFHRGIYRKVNADPQTAKKFEFGKKLSNFLLKAKIDVRKKLFKQIHDGFGGKLNLIIAGGAAISPELISSMQELGFHTIQGYGLTECAPILALNRDTYYKNESAGLPLPGVDIKIIDPDEDGIGEIIGKGDNVMLGYYNAPELNAEAIDQKGYYHTGDLGYMTEEQFVIITGRKSNLIVTKNGKNIYPEEIEYLINQSDLVQESVVYGVEDATGEELVTAEVFPNAEAIAEDPELVDLPLTDDRVKAKIVDFIKDDVNAKLIQYKRVREVILRDTEFPKNTSRKIKRYKSQN